MARNEQLIRQHRLLQILERYRYGRTLDEIRDELVEEMGLSSLHTRSVRRDLEALQAAGFDVDAHDSPRGRVWKLGPSFRGAHKITASASELLALSLGRDLLLPLSGTPFWIGIESFWSKMRESLPDAVWEHYARYRQTLLVRGMTAKSYDAQQGMIKTLHRAILEHRAVEIEYRSLERAKAETRRIEPYAVVFYQSSLYIIAEPQTGKKAKKTDKTDAAAAMRHYKLDRFRKATLLDEWFAPRGDFQIEDYLTHGLGIFAGAELREYRVRLTERAARWIREDPWHAEQQLQAEANGAFILTVAAAHDLEIIARVLALGDDAELLSPQTSRETLANMLRSMAKKYGD